MELDDVQKIIFGFPNFPQFPYFDFARIPHKSVIFIFTFCLYETENETKISLVKYESTQSLCQISSF